MIPQRKGIINLNTIIYLLLLIVSIWIIYLMVYGHGGFVERKKIINEIALLHNEINNLKNERAKLNWEIKNLSTNREYLNGLAHENGYRNSDEIIFKFLEINKLKNINKKGY